MILGYPLASVLAEKLVTMLELRDANTRDRDVGDIVRVVHTHTVQAEHLASALRATATHRGVELRPLGEVLSDLAARRAQPWARWRTRTGLVQQLPELFDEALEQVTAFADPVLSGTVEQAVWNPTTRRWER